VKLAELSQKQESARRLDPTGIPSEYYRVSLKWRKEAINPHLALQGNSIDEESQDGSGFRGPDQGLGRQSDD
jgi:hypothetical protein